MGVFDPETLFSRFGGILTLEMGRNGLSRVLFWKRELTEFCGELGEFGEKLGDFALACKKKPAERNSLSSLPGTRRGHLVAPCG